MSNTKGKHLTLDQRITIQTCLNEGATFKTIASLIGKSPCTISKEVKLNAKTRGKDILTKNEYGNIVDTTCPLLKKPPYVCNACRKRHSVHCPLQKRLYEAKYAQEQYEHRLHEYRKGIALNKPAFYEMDRIITEKVKEGQHLYHILKSQNFNISLSTLYRYVNAKYFSINSLDLPRKIKFKPRKKKHQYVPHKLKKGREYQDYLQYIEDNNILNWVEMDTVIGRIGGKAILTFTFTSCNFIFGILLDSKSSAAVSNAFRSMKTRFNKNKECFGKTFPLILTDNGSEFSDIFTIENDENGKPESKLFFCRPMRSSDKPRIEKNHTLFRDICPKGTSFDDFTQEQINLIFSHINSVKRNSLQGKSAYDFFEYLYGKKITSLLGIKKIPSKEVIQSPMLLKNKLMGKTLF